jgi:hypothetical protein
MLSEEAVRRYARALYPVAILLMLVPLVTLALQSMPPQFGTLQWRFAASGLLLGNYGTIILGVGLLGLVATLAGDRGVLRATGIVALVMAAVTLGVLALFLLDAVQIRKLAAANYKRPILVQSVGALFTGLVGLVAWLSIARAALTASRGLVTRGAAGARDTARPRAAAPLVVTTTSGASEA